MFNILEYGTPKRSFARYKIESFDHRFAMISLLTYSSQHATDKPFFSS